MSQISTKNKNFPFFKKVFPKDESILNNPSQLTATYLKKDDGLKRCLVVNFALTRSGTWRDLEDYHKQNSVQMG